MAQLMSTNITGNLTVSGYVEAANGFYVTSDKNLKTNIEKTNLHYYDLINNMQLYKYDWKDSKFNIPETHNLGIIAQDFQKILPDEYKNFFVKLSKNNSEALTINESKIVYLLIGALQEQTKINNELKEKIQQLENKLNN